MDGMHKGNIAFDQLGTDTQLLTNRDLWLKVLKNVRAGLMPPENKERPDTAKRKQLEDWIKFGAFALNPKDLDPGKVTVRRLNRVEYRNTIKDLMGVDFDADSEFPQDDTGYGFDNIADVLTVSPMLLEKYISAAEKIVHEAVPVVEWVEGKHGDTNHPPRKVRPKNFQRFFTRDAPGDPAQRRACASELLQKFVGRAFRRPADTRTVDRLTALAEEVYTQPGNTFEAGIAHAMVAVLASPRFLFREETLEPRRRGQAYALVDEFSLASRLSYFLWSSMPDEELFALAAAGELRKNLEPQVKRMLADKRSRAFVRNFTGQWLQARDIETIEIDARSVLQREKKPDPERDRKRARFRELRNRHEDKLSPEEKAELDKLRAEFVKQINAPVAVELNGELRRSMRRETERYFEHILREDRPLAELIDSDYTFLNERLAKHYGLTNVSGSELRLVKLPPESPRGGILTQGTILTVTSNPTRTSPVKRGLFILDNVLGMPPPPPPPNIPPLEDAAKGAKGHEPTLRETLALHRNKPLCSSCHNRMDPLGLALDNFNALGMWREQEHELLIDSTGKLITGEPFQNVRELKHILATNHRTQFYRCLTEKMLTYALGRGLEYYDVETVDEIVDRIQRADGRFSALLTGIIESVPFEKSRDTAMLADASPKTVTARPGREPDL
jgi:hypothetical protein